MTMKCSTCLTRSFEPKARIPNLLLTELQSNRKYKNYTDGIIKPHMPVLYSNGLYITATIIRLIWIITLQMIAILFPV